MLASLESMLLQKFQKSKHTASTDNITDEGPCQVMIFANNTVEMATYDVPRLAPWPDRFHSIPLIDPNQLGS